jgi:hypothetical protein
LEPEQEHIAQVAAEAFGVGVFQELAKELPVFFAYFMFI